jgi:hypothetical protein
MMALAAQYSGFLRTAAGQAEQAAGQATVAASAFEQALIATVQPAVVTANRALVRVLAATNWLGQNAPAIMDIESAYEQMWALDVVAMSGYHFDASQAAERLAPWRQVLQAIGANQAAKSAKNGSFNILGLLGGASSGTSQGSGSTNLGYGNTGSNNIGWGNFGNSNIGSGNTGSYNIGFGLTGDHQIGFGGFNSGSGNIGFGNSGTGNIGFFNSGTGNVGIGNSGSFNSGILNSGPAVSGTPGLVSSCLGSQTNPQTALLGAGSYATGGSLNAASISPGILNSVGAGTGSFAPSLPSPVPPSPSVASPVAALPGPTPSFTPAPAAAFDAGAPSASVTPAPTVPTAVASLRSTPATGFLNSAGNDSGSRSTTSREPDVSNASTNGVGIPSSGFFKSDLGSNVIPLFRQPTITD